MNVGVGMLLMAGLFFVSILVHELGHALAFRYYGLPSRIVLYWLGGLAIPDSGNAWSSQTNRSLTSNQHIVVSLAGPALGVALGILIIGVVYAMGGRVELIQGGMLPVLVPVFAEANFSVSRTLFFALFAGIQLNVLYNLLNLVPIYPLDGGQVARQVMTQMDSSNGVRNSIILSMACAILIAVFCLVNEARIMAFFCGYLAYTNYQQLQIQGGSRY